MVEMASLRAALLLIPPFSVVVAIMAARCLCRVMARKLSALACSLQLACLSSGGSSSFRYQLMVSSPSSSVEDIIKGGGGQLPVALYSRRMTTRRRCDGEEQEECVFCLSGIEEGSEVRELRCQHLFHRACLDRWVRARPVAATCPLCRGRLLAEYYYDDDDEEQEEEEAAVDDEEDSDMMLFMACVHSSSSSWLWAS